MERYAGCIDHQCCNILEDEKLNLIFRLGLCKPLGAVSCRKAVNDRFFHNALAVGNRIQFALNGVSLYGEGIELADPILPSNALGALKELVKGRGRKGGELDKHVLCTAQANVGARNVTQVTFKGHATVHCVKATESERVYFFAQQLFQAEQAGCNQLQFHKYSFWGGADPLAPCFYLL